MVDQGRTVTPRLEVQSTSDLDTLAQNLKEAEGGRTGDLAEQVQANLKNIVYGVLMVIALTLGGKWMLEARERTKGAASQRYEGVQRDFEELFLAENAPQDEARTSLQRAFEDKIRAITDVDSRSTYAQLADLYKIAAQFKSGDIESARSALEPYKIEQLQTEKTVSADNFKLELAILLKGKLFSSVTSTQAEGEKILRGLAEKGNIFAGEALLTHQRSFPLDVNLVDNTLKRLPHLREILSDELSSLGLQVAK